MLVLFSLMSLLDSSFVNSTAVPYGKDWSQDQEMTTSTDQEVLARPKRSLATLLDVWIGGMALTGLRIAYFPEKIVHDIIGDGSKEAKNKVNQDIRDKDAEVRKAKAAHKRYVVQKEERKRAIERSIHKLMARYKAEIQEASKFLGNPEEILEQLCDSEECLKYSIPLHEHFKHDFEQETSPEQSMLEDVGTAVPKISKRRRR